MSSVLDDILAYFLESIAYNTENGGDIVDSFEMEKKFQDRLSQLRSEMNVSAREMSLTIGQSSGYINHIENHTSLPSLRSFFYICEYLKISPKDFFDFEKKVPFLQNEVIEKLGKLNPKQLSHIWR